MYGLRMIALQSDLWKALQNGGTVHRARGRTFRTVHRARGRTLGPKAHKTILILKKKYLQKAARKLFEDTGIKITDQGERHLEAVIGTESFREQFIKNKVEGWVKDIQLLSKYAQDDPQAAYSAFTKG